MNKLHILIPSLAITCTLPALSIVSCGSSSSQWKQSDGEFEWKHETPELSFDDLEQAEDEYYNRITKKILADEIVKDRADWINNPEHLEHYKNWKISVKVNDIDKEHHLCSLVVHESGDEEMWQTNEFMHYDYTATLVKMPIVLAYDGYNNLWRFFVFGIWAEIGPIVDNKLGLDELYSQYKTWSFSFKGAMGSKKIDDTINYDCLDDLDNHQNILHCLNQVKFYSYFFKNVKYTGETL